MKQAIAIFLFIALFVQGVAHLAVIGFYRLNKEYIARNLCENRSRPEKKCCGKCYLRKQLKKVNDGTDNTQSSPVQKIEKSEVVYVLPAPMAAPDVVAIPEVAVQHPFQRHFIISVFASSFFHPPATATC